MFIRALKGRDFEEAIGLFRDYLELNSQTISDFQNPNLKKNIKKSCEIHIAEFLKHPTVFLGVRDRVASSTMDMAKFYVVNIPPSPEIDPTGLRGCLGISGELKENIVQIFELCPLIDLKHMPNPSSEELIQLIHIYSNLTWLFSTSWNYVRLKLEGVREPDWYNSFFKIR